MLTKQCEKVMGKLIGKGDFNVRLTVGKKPSPSANSSEAEQNWKELIIKAIGVGIMENPSDMYLIYCHTGTANFNVVTPGNKILSECWKYIRKVDIFRINIRKYKSNNNKVHSWIIVRE